MRKRDKTSRKMTVATLSTPVGAGQFNF